MNGELVLLGLALLLLCSSTASKLMAQKEQQAQNCSGQAN